MADERFLVTGALGCIGAWTVKRLVGAGVPVWTYDLPGDQHRLHLIMSKDDLAKVNIVDGDITDHTAFERVVADNGITHIVHLAAFQVPFVRANPIQGARVNVEGTTIVFEAAKRHKDHVRGLVYASSAAVYGPASAYPPGPLAHDAPFGPTTLYGVYKQANEGTAQIYWQENNIRSIGIRPYIIYGPGRDQGMTSTPTKGMLAAVVGRQYDIRGLGAAVFHHAEDAADVFIRAARAEADGATVYNLGGSEARVQDIVAAIEAAAPEARGLITFDPNPPATISSVDGRPLEAVVGPIAWRPLAEGVKQTMEDFRAAVKAGTIDVDRVLA
ncbi:MAG: NAD-dependent epimerase/dehydratase [Chloroflexi bacterium]|nr:NAD-dependent epimerase/dehydratase [Chloroflexota bacterium]